MPSCSATRPGPSPAQVVRLGSRRPVAVNARLIAATNVDLTAAVADGRFRADLFYRLNVAPIALLPLRERRADILPLAQTFIERHASDRASVVISEEARALLEAHRWPGNIRELENVIQFALIVCKSGEIRP